MLDVGSKPRSDSGSSGTVFYLMTSCIVQSTHASPGYVFKHQTNTPPYWCPTAVPKGLQLLDWKKKKKVILPRNDCPHVTSSLEGKISWRVNCKCLTAFGRPMILAMSMFQVFSIYWIYSPYRLLHTRWPCPQNLGVSHHSSLQLHKGWRLLSPVDHFLSSLFLCISTVLSNVLHVSTGYDFCTNTPTNYQKQFEEIT